MDGNDDTAEQIVRVVARLCPDPKAGAECLIRALAMIAAGYRMDLDEVCSSIRETSQKKFAEYHHDEIN